MALDLREITVSQFHPSIPISDSVAADAAQRLEFTVQQELQKSVWHMATPAEAEAAFQAARVRFESARDTADRHFAGTQERLIAAAQARRAQ